MTTSDEPSLGACLDISQEAELRWAEDARSWIRGERRVLRPLADIRTEVALERLGAASNLDQSDERN